MLKIIESENNNHVGENKKKKQIILNNTGRYAKDFLSMLKHRKNGKFDRQPNYVITLKGEVYEISKDIRYSNFFKDENINKNSIIISLENLGWVEKRPLKNYYINWINDIYKGDVHVRKWRDYFFWHPYTDEQLESCAELCKNLFKKFNIDKKCVGHNTKVLGVENFEGIATRSNFNSKFTDVSPAFDFEKFLKLLENE